jgi:ornithine cyclodeaminase
MAELGVRANAIAANDPAVAQLVAEAGIVVTATSSATPVLDGSWMSDGACVVAIGSHEPDCRELDSRLLARSVVVVEDLGTAMREAGDVVMAIGEGAIAAADLRPMKELVTGRVTRADDRPNVFKSVGMSWQDLVIAEGVARATAGAPSSAQ